MKINRTRRPDNGEGIESKKMFFTSCFFVCFVVIKKLPISQSRDLGNNRLVN